MAEASTTPRIAEPKKPRRDNTHWLYIGVIVAVIAGIVFGLVAPNVAKEFKVLGTMFVNLIKMMISPVIFCTIVLGIGSVRAAASVGKAGGIALGYFITMSTFALAVGLAVGNIIEPGHNLNIEATKTAGAEYAAKADHGGGTIGFIQSIIPDTLFSALTEGSVLQTLFVALLVGFAVQSMGRKGEPILGAIAHLQRLVFKILTMILWIAPIGAFGAIAGVVGATGIEAVKQLAILMVAFYITCVIFVFGVLGLVLRLQHFQIGQIFGPRVSAYSRNVFFRVGLAESDAQDGACGSGQVHRGHRRAHRLFLQPGWHRHLSHHVGYFHFRCHEQAAVAERTNWFVGLYDYRI